MSKAILRPIYVDDENEEFELADDEEIIDAHFRSGGGYTLIVIKRLK